MSETRFCIMCGEPFESNDPTLVFCPAHGGKESASPSAEINRRIQPLLVPKAKRDCDPPGSITSWQPGDLILDTYEVRGKLGEGGFGAVYRAHHRGWNMDLAVKRALNLDEEDKQDFVDEAQKWIDLGLHPHIISCYYVRNIDGFPHTFAELAEGGSLHDWIGGDKGNLYDGDDQEVLARILDIAIQFAWGLGYAHEQGLVHQDVKPHNALMTTDGVLKVTDFGLAKARGTTGAAHVEGLGEEILVSGGSYTPAYCSPEQAGRQKLSLKTDIWSWGVSVLEMFNGGVSWMGGQVAAAALESYLQSTGEEEDIPPMPGAVAELLRDCFQEDPKDRPKDMLAVAERLLAIYQQETGQTYFRELPKAADLRADSLNNKALSMLDLGKTFESEVFLEQALTVEVQHVEANYNLGLLRWRSGLAADVDVLKKLQLIQQDKPEDNGLAIALGWICMESGRFSEALAYFVQADQQMSDPAGTEGIRLARQLAEKGAGSCLRTFEGHGLGATGISVAVSPDGCQALSGSKDQTLKLWDLTGGTCLHTFKGHAGGVSSVAISPDGRWALSGSGGYFGSQNELKLWDLVSGVCLRTFEGHLSYVDAVAITPDGRRALSGSSDKTLKLWDLATGVCLRTFEGHTGWVQSVAISPDGRWVLSGSQDNTLKLWNLAEGVCQRTIEGHTSIVKSVAFSPNGIMAISGSGDKTLKLWNLENGDCLRTFEGHEDIVDSVAFSQDGLWALSGSWDSKLKLWELASGTCLRTFNVHDRVYSVAISPDGRKALCGCGDSTLKVWDLAWVTENRFSAPLRYTRGLAGSEADQRARTYAAYLVQIRQLMVEKKISEALMCLEKARSVAGFKRASSTLDASVSLGSKSIVSAFRKGWLSQTFEGHSDWVNAIAFSPDGRWALSGSHDETLKLWDLATGDCLRRFEGHTSSVKSVAFSPDGCWVLSGSHDQTLKLWDLATGDCLHTYEGNTVSVNSIAISPDGRWALSGCYEKLKLWDLAGGICLRTIEGHTADVKSVAISPDGCWALSCGGGLGDHTIKLWDLATGACLRTIEGHTWSVNAVAFSPDGRWSLSGSDDHTLKLWDLATGDCLCTIEGHIDGVNSISFSPDGRWALSGSWDKTLKLWDLTIGACLRTYKVHTDEVRSVAFSPNGHWALSGSRDRTLNLWSLEWEFTFPGWAEWDEGARPFLETFLTLNTPYAAQLPKDREPSAEEIRLALIREGQPTWTEADFQVLLKELGYHGYGWLREEGVRKKLEELARERG